MNLQDIDKERKKLYSSLEHLFNTNDGDTSDHEEEIENLSEKFVNNTTDESSEQLEENNYLSFTSHDDSIESLKRRPIHGRLPCQSTPSQSSSEFSPKSTRRSPCNNIPKSSRQLSPSRNASPSHQRTSSPERSLSPERPSPQRVSTGGKHRASRLYPDLSEIKKSYNTKENKDDSPYPWIYKLLCLVFSLIAILFAYLSMTPFTNKKPMNEREISVKTVQIEEELLSLQVYFPKQSTDFWNILGAQIKSVLLLDEPPEPATFLFVVPKGAESTINCFIKYLIKRLDRIMQTQHDSQTYTDSFQFHGEEAGVWKFQMDKLLKNHFRAGKVVSVVEHIEVLKGEDVMLFHGYCDTVNAPFKRAIFLLTYHPPSPLDTSTLDSSLRMQMEELWGDELGEDTFGSLMTRISNSVVLVNPEPIIHCTSH